MFQSFGLLFFQGRVGQIRFVFRKDLDPASYGSVSVDEIRGEREHNGNDLLLVAKKFMADPEPYKIATVLTAAECATIRRSFVQPSGVWKRRTISPKVQQRIASQVPVCLRQKTLTAEAAAYLSNWATGTLQRAPRPVSYRCLTRRIFPADGPGHSIQWGPRGRERHVDLGFDDDDADTASDDAYLPVQDEDDQ